jgi:exopolysaccharide production protein ExoQ
MVTERKSLRFYYLSSAIFLLQAMEAFGIFDRLVYGEWEAKSGDKITQGLNLLMIVNSVLLFWRAVRNKKIPAGGVLALAVVGFLLLSVVWSIDPQTTIRRGVIYLFVILGTIGVVGSLDGDKAMDLLRTTCGLCAVASIVLLVISPSYALMSGSSELRGIFSHKNILGQVMAAGVLADLHILRVRGGGRLFNMFMLFLFIIVAFFSKSSTAMLVILAFCIVGSLIALLRKGAIARVVSVFLIMFLVPTAAIVAWSPDSLLEMIGKDPTLTGRTDLWPYVLNYIHERPILGWGYSAFWSPANAAAIKISIALGWTVPEAHNGLLELLLEVGSVGTAFFAVLWVRSVVLALRGINTSAKEHAISSLLCCGGIVLVGLTEQVLLDPDQVLTSGLFFLTGLMCERAIRGLHRRRYPATLRSIPRVLPMNYQKTNFWTQ